jgi:hypothetical protein
VLDRSTTYAIVGYGRPGPADLPAPRDARCRLVNSDERRIPTFVDVPRASARRGWVAVDGPLTPEGRASMSEGDKRMAKARTRSRAVRGVAFLGALGVSAGLVGLAAQGTGAYFTDSKDGGINAGTGHIKVDVAPDGLQLNMGSLLPGEFGTKTVTYYAHPSGDSSEDIWLVFPTDGSADAFIAPPSSDPASPTPLGRYGHFSVASTGGASFVSNNLARDPAGYNTGSSCGIDGNGWGGSSAAAANRDDRTVPYCAPMTAILLQSGMHDGDSGHADLEFGFTKLLKGPQDGVESPVVKFQIVATQHGVRPEDPNN